MNLVHLCWLLQLFAAWKSPSGEISRIIADVGRPRTRTQRYRGDTMKKRKETMKSGKRKRIRNSGNVTHVNNRKSHLRNRYRERIPHSEVNDSSLRLTLVSFVRSLRLCQCISADVWQKFYLDRLCSSFFVIRRNRV